MASEVGETKSEGREGLKSRLGFLMVAAGCAVGLGNVWRFPFIVGRNGGAAFVLVYLVFLALLGFPLLTAELAVGRAARKGVSGALRALAPERTRKLWYVLGCVIFGGNVLLMAYYTCVGGWLLRYTAGYASKGVTFTGGGAQAAFEGLLADPAMCTGFMLLVVAVAVGVCLAGVQRGVERVTKWMMLSLLALLGVLAVKALSLPGAMKGVEFYLAPDWTPLLEHPFRVCFDAMGQAFFTLSVGVGCMTIFGSYVGRGHSLVTESLWITAIDTCVAFLAGLVVFPACAAFGVDVSAGPGLIFIALPEVFADMGGGGFWGTVFFLFLSLAALTTVVAVFECLIGGLMDELRWPRSRTALLVGGVVAVLSLPAVFGYNIWGDVHIIPKKTILDVEDFVFSQFWLPLGALATCVFCTWPFGWGWDGFRQEAGLGVGLKPPRVWKHYMRWLLPVILLGIIAGGLRAAASETAAVPGENVVSIAGRWGFAFGNVTNCADTITLPSTTDIARKGDGRIKGVEVEKIDPVRDDAAVGNQLVRHLTRRFPYVGFATYEREIDIPSTWAGRRIELFLERTKVVDIYLDGKRVGRSETLAAPAVIELPRGTVPGRHALRLVVDNRQGTVPVSGHQTSDDTQTNWNGVMGRMELRAYGEVSIARVKTFPSAAEGKVTAKVVFRNDGVEDVRVGVEIGVVATGKMPVAPVAGETPATPIMGDAPASPVVKSSFSYVAPGGVSTGEFTVALGPDAPKWSEFNPVLHTLTVKAGEASATVRFGLRDFRTKGTQFTLNGRPVFLRGTHDACVWPLTGAAPMEVEPWRKYFATLKEYGLNHVRFHSWCPPEAAFEAADEAGFFLQPEFGAFGGSFAKDARLRAFCLAESKRIIDAYGNHPSFVMFTLGNECRGGRKERAKIVRALRAHDPRPLYAIATNGDFMNPEQCEEDDFWATFRSCNGAEGNARGSYAHCNAPLGAVQLPGGGTMRDFSSAVRHSTIPLIGHETGQFQAYPDYSEIPKYTGVLKPINLEIFKARLEKAGLGEYAADFCDASGRLMALNYREEMEEAFRTPGFGGFQLLDIQDFPGQGTALVGILNSFMEPKGFIPPEKWRMSCSPTVLLARFPKYTYVSGEKFGAEIQIAHYGKEDVLNGDLTWRIVSTSRTGGSPVLGGQGAARPIAASGMVKVAVPVGEVKSVGKIDVALPHFGKAERLELQLLLATGKEQNSYSLWVYPEAALCLPKGVEIVRDLKSADCALAEGRTALCILDLAKAPTNAVPGFFASDFWNWEMFNGPARKRKVIAPGTLGLLVKREHPALAGFPTSFHSDYQWRELIFKGVNVVLDGDKDADVIVRGIDNITRNQNLGVIWEKRRGNGIALYCSLDLEAAKDLPEARALRRSLLEYLATARNGRMHD